MLESGGQQATRFTVGMVASLAIFVAFAALISTALLIEVKSVVLSSPGEVLNHLMASGGFTLAASGVLLIITRARPTALTLMGVGSAITIALEAAQALTPSRDAEVDDLLAGLAGVLLASIVLEAVFHIWSRRAALRMQVLAAGIGCVGLAALLLFSWSPGTISSARPDGVSCPLTELTGDGNRITIGDTTIPGSCLETESGGLGLVGRLTPGHMFDQAVLVTSELDTLRDQIRQSGRMHMRLEIVTGDFETDRRSVIALLRTRDGRHVVNVRSHRHRLEVNGPNLNDALQASVAAQMLEPEHRHILDVVLSQSELEVRLDGQTISSTVISSDWYADLDTDKLQLLIGNNAHRSTPFNGVVEWIELTT